MTDEYQLVELVVALAHVDASEAEITVAAGRDARSSGLSELANLVRQSPMNDRRRDQVLQDIEERGRAWDGMAVAATAHILRTHPPRYPAVSTPLELPALSPLLNHALMTLFQLEERVGAPWTLVGGLMVMLHCAEHAVPVVRATEDADIAINVFTHRAALRDITHELRALGYEDVTPDSLTSRRALSYRWDRDGVSIDLMVPEQVNQQNVVPLSVTRRPSVELPGVQQAMARSELVAVTLSNGARGRIRRPNLLGAVVLKAVAAMSDRRDPDRHVEDVVALCTAMAVSGLHTEYAGSLRLKDRSRLDAVRSRITPPELGQTT